MRTAHWLVLDEDSEAVAVAPTQYEAEQIASDYKPPYRVVEYVPADQASGETTGAITYED